MSKHQRQHGSEFKLKVALEAIREKKTVAELCLEYGIASSLIFSWKKQLIEGGGKVFEKVNVKSQQGELDRVHLMLGKVLAERDFLERVLKR